MKILHLSDTHGLIPKLDLDGIDVVVHSGDFLPNKTRGFLPIEEPFQVQWMRDNHSTLRLMMVPSGVPFLVLRGNHDFINPAEYLFDCAWDLSGKLVTVNGVKFFGYPFTPLFTGEWWGELTPRQEEAAMEGLLLVLERDKPDVLVSHGPMYGLLDRNRQGERCGSQPLRDLLMLKTKHLPKIMLHGHVHEDHGKAVCGDMRVYNSATIAQVVEL